MAETRLRLADLARTTDFDLRPDSNARAALTETLGLLALKKLRFAGSLSPDGDRDWRLNGTLGATVTQPCVVTFEPVTTRIDEPVIRRYLAATAPLPEGEEIEMPDDDTVEPMPDAVDLLQVMEEALALALPAWPRAEGVDPVELRVAAPGTEPMSNEDAKPFSSLKSLKDRLSDGGSDSGSNGG